MYFHCKFVHMNQSVCVHRMYIYILFFFCTLAFSLWRAGAFIQLWWTYPHLAVHFHWKRNVLGKVVVWKDMSKIFMSRIHIYKHTYTFMLQTGSMDWYKLNLLHFKKDEAFDGLDSNHHFLGFWTMVSRGAEGSCFDCFRNVRYFYHQHISSLQVHRVQWKTDSWLKYHRSDWNTWIYWANHWFWSDPMASTYS